MRSPILLVAVSLVVGTLAGAIASRVASAQTVQNDPGRSFPQPSGAIVRWQQYCVVMPSGDPARAYIAARGSDGWELVSGGFADASGPWLLCFRRPLH